MGAGLALVFMRDFTTGGSDIVAKLVQVKRPDMQMGQMILIVDICVVLSSGFVYGRIESVLYAGITIFIYTQVVDFVLYRKGDKGSGVPYDEENAKKSGIYFNSGEELARHFLRGR